MSTHPTTAMLLAAGLAVRMRPLTNATAKPLLPLGGRPLIEHALEHLVEAGVQTVVVNAFWQADRLAAHLAGRTRPRVILRRETALLDTGGGVRAALDVLGDAPFFVVNGDAFWLDGPHPALARLAEAFDSELLDAVLLVYRTAHVRAEVGFGDFMVDKLGRLHRRGEREVVPYIYAGVQIVSPALFAGAPDGPFSMNLLWDRAIAADRVRAVVHDGLWFHLSTPADLSEAESVLHLRREGEPPGGAPRGSPGGSPGRSPGGSP
jgi:MurNAc alpha-1-phosphate uridylyltransferase